MIDRYGEALEFDLLERGIRLHDYFLGLLPWAHFDNVVFRLPRGTHFRAAEADDPERAEALLAMGVEEGTGGPPLVGYTLEIEKADQIIDLLSLIRVEQVKIANPRAPLRFNPIMRPITALQRLMRRKREEKVDELFDRLMPGR